MATFKNKKNAAMQLRDLPRHFPKGFEVVEWKDGLCVIAPYAETGDTYDRYWLNCGYAARGHLYAHPLWMRDRQEMLKRAGNSIKRDLTAG